MVIDGLSEELMVLSASWASWLPSAVIKTTVLLGAVWLSLRVARRLSADVRHGVWSLAIGGCLLLPLLEAALPRWGILPAAMWTRSEAGDTRSSPAVKKPASTASNRPHTAVLPPMSDFAYAGTPMLDEPDSQSGSVPGAFTLIDGMSWTAALLSLWTVGFAFCVTRTLVGSIRLSRCRRRAVLISGDGWEPLIRTLHAQLGIRRRIPVLISRDALMPMAAGVLNPFVLLPAEARGWAESRRRAVLAHELAHVVRRDALSNLLVQAACVVYWFNPLVFAARVKMIVERERACDDMVLSSGSPPREYAQHVLGVAARFARVPQRGVALAMARRSQLEGRLLSILDPQRDRRRLSARMGMIGLGAAMLVTTPLAAIGMASPKPVELQGDQRSARDESDSVEVAVPAVEESDDWTIDSLVEALRSSDRALRRRAEGDLDFMGPNHPLVDGVVDRLLVDLDADDPSLRTRAAWQIEKTKSPRAFDALVERLVDLDGSVRAAATGALGESDDPRAIDHLITMTGDEDDRVRTWALRSLGAHDDPRSVKALHRAMADPSPLAREWAMRSLAAC